MASVELRGVEKAFGETKIVRGVSLAIAERELLVLVGPSGCGKSTCLRMIAGLETPTAGQVVIGGRDVTQVPPRDRDVGMVFQSYALYPHMNVAENIGFGLSLRGVPKATIASKVDEVAKSLELTHLLTRLPKELSGGQRQRVAMGRVIARSPSVFLFDEPLSNLDAALRVQMRAEVAALHRRLDATMVYVTHDQVEALTLADRIAVLEGGVLQQVGPPDELFHRPANRFVAGFIGSPAMAFLEGELKEGAFRVGELALPLPPSAKLPDGKATLGARPHDLTIDDAGPGLSGEVEVVEPLGWEGYAHVRLGGTRVTVRLQGAELARVKAGGTARVRFDPAKVHLFSGQDGRALLHPAGSP